jgi:acetoin utilization protein AcuB
MLAKDLISDIVPALHTSDTGVKALYWMDVFRVSHLPVVNDREFLGLISDNDIYDLNKAEEPIGNHFLSLLAPYVFDYQHVYEVISVISKLKLTLVPVLDTQKNYLGVITLNDLLQQFANLTAVKDPGGILILELNEKDYSLTEISQIVEGNDAKILSLYVTSPADSTLLELTLKINRTDMSAVIQTFNRFNYNIKASFLENEEIDNLYNRRYEEFLRYLDI